MFGGQLNTLLTPGELSPKHVRRSDLSKTSLVLLSRFDQEISALADMELKTYHSVMAVNAKANGVLKEFSSNSRTIDEYSLHNGSIEVRSNQTSRRAALLLNYSRIEKMPLAIK
jgi:hypothetical protein